jgi:glyoxylase-like metal-dependent hydrolase (beta-lactamase superfamily II)
MRELAPGLWQWETSHPGWEASEPWDRMVSSCVVDDGGRLLLFDPLGLPEEIEALAGERETAIVLTAPWHERDAQSLVERLGLTVYTPPPDTAQDLIDKFGVTAEQAGDGSPDLLWLREAGGGKFYLSSDDLPFEIDVFPGRHHNDVVLWVESKRAVIVGDTLADFGQGSGFRTSGFAKA